MFFAALFHTWHIHTHPGSISLKWVETCWDESSGGCCVHGPQSDDLSQRFGATATKQEPGTARTELITFDVTYRIRAMRRCFAAILKVCEANGSVGVTSQKSEFACSMFSSSLGMSVQCRMLSTDVLFVATQGAMCCCSQVVPCESTWEICDRCFEHGHTSCWHASDFLHIIK